MHETAVIRMNRAITSITSGCGQKKRGRIMEKPEIIYEDQALLVCYKPAGMPVQTKEIRQKDLEKQLLSVYGKIYVVHRLDQPVEGIMTFAKEQTAAAKLSRQFQSSFADKQYLAVVEGNFSSKTAILTDYLKKDTRRNYSQAVSKDTPGAKKAVLSYTVLESKETRQLLKISLKTGRHHQIRVQLSHAGHPIAGDRKYNINCQREDAYMPLALCAYALEFMHPVTKDTLHFEITPKGRLFQNFAL